MANQAEFEQRFYDVYDRWSAGHISQLDALGSLEGCKRQYNGEFFENLRDPEVVLSYHTLHARISANQRPAWPKQPSVFLKHQI